MASQDDEYNMAHGSRGIAVIINNENFKDKELKKREGTQVDEDNIKSRLTALKFEVRSHKDKTGNDMKKIMREAAKENHSDRDCFVCVILSHGKPDEIHGTDVAIGVNDLLEPFKGDQCKSLLGKPKIFFIQACRGETYDDGALGAVGDGPDDNNEKRIPIEADFLVAYSTVPGYFSWRNPSNGSWFIQALSAVLEKHGSTLDLMTMMTRVNKSVAYEFESNATKQFKKKQIPCITSMLTKDVYFRPKK